MIAQFFIKNYVWVHLSHARRYSSKHRRLLMMEFIILKTTSYESDFFFMVNFKQHFKPNGCRMFFAQSLFYAVVFDLAPSLLLLSIPLILYMKSNNVSWHIELKQISLKACVSEFELSNIQSSHQTPSGWTSPLHHQLIIKRLIKVPRSSDCSYTLKLQWTYTNSHLFWYIHTKSFKAQQNPAGKSSNPNAAPPNMKHSNLSFS